MKGPRLKRPYILPILAAVATLSTFACAEARAAAGVAPHPSAAPAASLVLGGAAGKRLKEQERAEQGRRQAAYRSWFYRKYGAAPSAGQARDWYYRSYGVYPS